MAKIKDTIRRYTVTYEVTGKMSTVVVRAANPDMAFEIARHLVPAKAKMISATHIRET